MGTSEVAKVEARASSGRGDEGTNVSHGNGEGAIAVGARSSEVLFVLVVQRRSRRTTQLAVPRIPRVPVRFHDPGIRFPDAGSTMLLVPGQVGGRLDRDGLCREGVGACGAGGIGGVGVRVRRDRCDDRLGLA